MSTEPTTFFSFLAHLKQRAVEEGPTLLKGAVENIAILIIDPGEANPETPAIDATRVTPVVDPATSAKIDELTDHIHGLFTKISSEVKLPDIVSVDGVQRYLKAIIRDFISVNLAELQAANAELPLDDSSKLLLKVVQRAYAKLSVDRERVRVSPYKFFEAEIFEKAGTSDALNNLSILHARLEKLSSKFEFPYAWLSNFRTCSSGMAEKNESGEYVASQDLHDVRRWLERHQEDLARAELEIMGEEFYGHIYDDLINKTNNYAIVNGLVRGGASVFARKQQQDVIHLIIELYKQLPALESDRAEFLPKILSANESLAPLLPVADREKLLTLLDSQVDKAFARLPEARASILTEMNTLLPETYAPEILAKKFARYYLSVMLSKAYGDNFNTKTENLISQVMEILGNDNQDEMIEELYGFLFPDEVLPELIKQNAHLEGKIKDEFKKLLRPYLGPLPGNAPHALTDKTFLSTSLFEISKLTTDFLKGEMVVPATVYMDGEFQFALDRKIKSITGDNNFVQRELHSKILQYLPLLTENTLEGKIKILEELGELDLDGLTEVEVNKRIQKKIIDFVHEQIVKMIPEKGLLGALLSFILPAILFILNWRIRAISQKVLDVKDHEHYTLYIRMLTLKILDLFDHANHVESGSPVDELQNVIGQVGFSRIESHIGKRLVKRFVAIPEKSVLDLGMQEKNRAKLISLAQKSL